MGNSWRPRIAAVLTAVLVLAVTLAFDLFARKAHLTETRAEMGESTDALSHRISGAIARESDAIEGLVAIYEIAKGDRDILDEQFPIFAEVLMESGDSLLSVQLAPGSVLDYVYPHQGNEEAVGLDLMADPDRRRLLEPSIATGDTTVQGPVELVQGGLGLLVRQPLYQADGEFWGFAETVIDWPSVAERVGLQELGAITSAARDPEDHVVLFGDPSVFDADPVLRTVPVGSTDTRWELGTLPVDGWPTTAPMTPYLWVIGGLVASVLAWMASWWARRPEALVAEKARALADLRAAEELFEKAFDNAGVGILTADLEGRVLSMNPSMCDMVGRTPDQSGVLLADLTDRSEGNGLADLSGLRNGATLVEVELMLPNNTWVHSRATLARRTGFEEPMVMAIVENVTKARRAEADLSRSEQRLRGLFQLAPVAILRKDYSTVKADLDGLRGVGVVDLPRHLHDNPSALAGLLRGMKVIDRNPAAIAIAQRLGFDPGSGAAAHLSGENQPEFEDALLMLWDGRSESEVTMTVLDREGRDTHLVVRRNVTQVDGVPDYSNVIVTVTDVSELREVNRRLEQLLESKDRFLASVAHELRTPLTAVLGFAHHLKDDRKVLSDRDREEFEELIQLNASEMSHSIDDLLVWARADIGEVKVIPQTFDLATETFRALRSIPDLQVRVEEPDGTVEAWADPSRVRQITRNLITNAIRYGGEKVLVRVRRSGATAFLEVADDGVALTPAEMERVFDPYTRSDSPKAEPGSIGIGLTVSRALAHVQGGDLVFVREGDFNVFRLSLPAIEQLRLL